MASEFTAITIINDLNAQSQGNLAVQDGYLQRLEARYYKMEWFQSGKTGGERPLKWDHDFHKHKEAYNPGTSHTWQPKDTLWISSVPDDDPLEKWILNFGIQSTNEYNAEGKQFIDGIFTARFFYEFDMINGRVLYMQELTVSGQDPIKSQVGSSPAMEA